MDTKEADTATKDEPEEKESKMIWIFNFLLSGAMKYLEY